MNEHGWRMADSDMHVMEPPDLWQRYIDPRFLDVAPIGLDEIRRDMRVLVKDHVLSISNRARTPVGASATAPRRAGIGWRPTQDDAYGHAEERGWDAPSQLEAMDAEGLDCAVLFPSRGLFVLGLDTAEQAGADGYEPELAAAVARAYNDWLHDFCAEDPTRLYGAGLLAPHDVDAAADEVRRVVGDFGFKTVFLHPGCVNRRPWHDPVYDPIWRACEELDVPICFHGGGQNFLRPDYTLEVFDNLMMWHTFGQPLGIMAVIVSFASGGVIQRFPNLRVGLLEGNCGWAPWLLNRLDEHWEWTGAADAPDLDRPPSEFFRSNCFVSVEADEGPVKYYVDWFGDDNVVFSTDYPHGDSKYPDSSKEFLELPIPDETKRKILWDNWCRLYGMPVD
jgi:predicted TIM-barrel fold metal-dependent hydrolase